MQLCFISISIYKRHLVTRNKATLQSQCNMLQTAEENWDIGQELTAS